MGVFVNILAAPKCTEDRLLALVAEGAKEDWEIDASQCQKLRCEIGAAVWLNDHCCGYEEMTQELSRHLGSALMLCYIYDDDIWGYYFYDAGERVDCFCSAPDYFEQASDKERLRLKGCAEMVVPYFFTTPESIHPYLVQWDEEYEGDTPEMANFLNVLGIHLPENGEEICLQRFEEGIDKNELIGEIWETAEEDFTLDFKEFEAFEEQLNKLFWESSSVLDFIQTIQSIYEQTQNPAAKWLFDMLPSILEQAETREEADEEDDGEQDEETGETFGRMIVYVEADAQNTQGETSFCLQGKAITQTAAEELCRQYQEGKILRLEFCWTTEVHCSDRSLVLLRDNEKWACLYFDDAQHQSYAMIANAKEYYVTDYKELLSVPFGMGYLNSCNIYDSPEEILRNLPKAVGKCSSSPGIFLQNDRIWSHISSSVYYNKQQYNEEKRLLGGFPIERALNFLLDQIAFKIYPKTLSAVTQEGGKKSLDTSGVNRDMPRFYLHRFFQQNLRQLVFHFDGGAHLVLLEDAGKGMLILLQDELQQVSFGMTQKNAARKPEDMQVTVFRGDTVPTAFVFEHMQQLRGVVELLLARMDKPHIILSKSGLYCAGNPCKSCTYEEMRRQYLPE